MIFYLRRVFHPAPEGEGGGGFEILNYLLGGVVKQPEYG